jgi:hypothetical protein
MISRRKLQLQILERKNKDLKRLFPFQTGQMEERNSVSFITGRGKSRRELTLRVSY